MIIEISGNYLDLREIALIGKLDSTDRDWANYSVLFRSGKEIKIYENPRDVNANKVQFCMPREKLLAAWISFCK